MTLQAVEMQKAKRQFDVDRSHATRQRLFQATIDCLIQHGYAATTTGLVATTAGVSRGAMQHQFATKAELMLATFEYCSAEADRENRERIRAYDRPQDRFMALPRLAWEVSTEPWAIAMCEMEFGSRSDKEFTALFAPIAGAIQTARVERVWERAAERAGLTNLSEVKDLAVFHLASIRGLMLTRLAIPEDDAKVSRAFALLEKQTRTLISSWFKEQTQNEAS